MQPGKLIIGEDAAVFLDKVTKQSKVEFQWRNHDIFTEIDVYLVRNDKSKSLVTEALSDGGTLLYDALGIPLHQTPNGRIKVGINSVNLIRYYFTKNAHVDPFNKKYPLFKFRIEMVGNPSVFAETNEFKVVY